MFSPRVALAGALSGAAVLASVMLAAPASAATVSTCFDAQTSLTAAQHQLALDEQTDSTSDSTVSGGADFTPDAQDQAVASDRAAVSIAQGNVNALCGTGVGLPSPTPHPHPWPTPTPVPPVGFPGGFGGGLLNCSQLEARGISNIPVGSPYYRRALDANDDGIACQTASSTTVYQTIDGQKCHLVNGQWVAVSNPSVVYRVVNGHMCHQVSGQWIPIDQPPVTVVTVPAPCNCPPRPVPAPVQQTVYAPPPQVVSAPAPEVITAPAPVYTAPSAPVVIPNTSAGVNTGNSGLAAE